MNLLLAAATQLHGRLPSFPCRVLAYREKVPSGLFGVYVSVSGPSAEHVVGLLALPNTWEGLTQLLEHDRPRSEGRSVVEAGCELARTLADAFHGTLAVSSCVIGLPLFAEGIVSGGRGLQLQVTDVVLGGHAVLLALFSRVVMPGAGAQGDAA